MGFAFLMLGLFVTMLLLDSCGMRLSSPLVSKTGYHERVAREYDGPPATTPADSAARGQDRCDEFGQGKFVMWLDEANGRARCLGRTQAADAGGMPGLSPASRHQAAKTGQERCDEIRPGSVFVRWVDEDRGVARCGTPKR